MTEEQILGLGSEVIDEEVWSTRFVVVDVLLSATGKDKEFIEKMTEQELREFINENLHSWKKGFEWGIMEDWDVVASTCISNSDFPDSLLDRIDLELEENSEK